MGVISVKCRKCRHLLFLHPEITLLNGHSVSPTELSVKYVECSTIQEDNLWFLQDTNLPSWISDVVNKANWTKGKICCPNCQGRLGSFDFVSGNKCQCSSYILPPVHIVKCKVDCRNI
ncbi:hypothetical protein RUM44_000772 [Polyplax serrata]|uniref:E3 ubiquitin-protein ligase n=1 Tax=Polyplax serrata TaxID=468196 RepID=A0ABR1B9A1_POLSC